MEYKRCTRCVMDNCSDNKIVFDDLGRCNYCERALSEINTTVYFPGNMGKTKLEELVAKIKKKGKGKKYDAIMGISGGLDSSYLTLLGYKLGLRILLVHIDDGFDTEISKRNLQKLVSTTGYDYKIIVPDKEQFCDLTKAYMLAGVPNLAVPQDNVLLAYIYKCMKENDIKYFLSGGNFALECILQQGNTHSNTDVVNIKDINKRFGNTKIDRLIFLSSLQRKWDAIVLHIKSPRPLNYIDYNRDKAFKELYDFCGFEYYGSKHLENILTAFIQLYWLPKKFNVDKRTSHFSSMIVSGQMTRDQALEELKKPLYDSIIMEEYINTIKAKLNISDEEFERIMSAPTHQHTDYRTENDTLFYKLIYLVKKIFCKR